MALVMASLLLFACKEEPPVEPDPLITLNDLTRPEGNGNSKFAFRVRLSKAAPKAVSFNYKTVQGTAKANQDFIPVDNGAGLIPEGSTETTIEIEVIGNEFKDPDKTFTVELFNIVNAEISKATAIGTIANDDTQLAISEMGFSTPNTYAGYRLAWADEFNGTSLDPASWTYEIGDGCPTLCGWGNNELQYYTNQPENLYFTQGKMVIEAKRETIGGRAYSSARIVTQGKKSFKYGRVDIRAILPEGRGLWPAFWMLGESITSKGWPACGEIDIMELVGHQPSTVHSTVHFGPNTASRQFRGFSRTLGAGKFIDEFHVFSINWEEDLIEFFVDGVRFYTVTPSTTAGFDYPFNDNFFFLFNIAVGGDWPGAPDGSTVFPQRMIVDYIRVFEKE